MSGGMGALGTLAGRWLVSQSVRHITLLGRSGRMEGSAGPLEGLLGPGWAAEVTLQKCDMAAAEDAAAVLGHQPQHGEGA